MSKYAILLAVVTAETSRRLGGEYMSSAMLFPVLE
jgi:hypothetical protein